MLADKSKRDTFIAKVNASLKTHYELIKALVERGAYFFDYGNSFLKAIYDAGVKEVSKNGHDDKDGFVFPSYVEDIMGPLLFDYGYGPFRWVCLSGKPEDLRRTDEAAMNCIDRDRRYQDLDNYNWIRDAEKNKMVVGTQARILYQDAEGRIKIALKFNELVRQGVIGPVMLGRDHHDVSGTDSPFRETSNIKDGSNVMADMAVQCYVGNAARGMSLVALHNGGGTGIGKAINGGFGLVLDGSERVDEVIKNAMLWDVMGGVARRNWARNSNAIETVVEYNKKHKGESQITIPYLADEQLVAEKVRRHFIYCVLPSKIKAPYPFISRSAIRSHGTLPWAICRLGISCPRSGFSRRRTAWRTGLSNMPTICWNRWGLSAKRGGAVLLSVSRRNVTQGEPRSRPCRLLIPCLTVYRSSHFLPRTSGYFWTENSGNGKSRSGM
jgi:urocanate hydratase